MALVFQLFSEPPQNLLLGQKIVMFDEPLVRYYFLHLAIVVVSFILTNLLARNTDEIPSALPAHTSASVPDVPVMLSVVPDFIPDGGQLSASQTRGAWHVG